MRQNFQQDSVQSRSAQRSMPGCFRAATAAKKDYKLRAVACRFRLVSVAVPAGILIKKIIKLCQNKLLVRYYNLHRI